MMSPLSSASTVEIRLRNALRAGSTTATGQRLEASAGLVPCLEALRPRWDEAVAEADRVNPEALSAGSPVRRGVGIGAMSYGIGNTSLPNPVDDPYRASTRRSVHAL